MSAATRAFCDDDELGYVRSRTAFLAGASLRLDAAYRLAHLPLVAPDHPHVIAAKDGAPYRIGWRPPVCSLVLPIAWDDLSASPAFAALEEAVRRAPFAHKIAWAAAERRRAKLHATICGSMRVGTREAPELTCRQRDALAALGGFDVELRGLFSGDVNLGRLYLRAYPERRGKENCIRLAQRALGLRESDLYVVGLWNLTDDLDARETAALAQLIEEWWERTLLRMRVERLRFLWSEDDLALAGGFCGEAALA